MKKLLLASFAGMLSIFGLYGQKLSPHTQAFLDCTEEHRAKPQLKFNALSVSDSIVPEYVKVFINMKSEEALDSIAILGGKVSQTFGTYASAMLQVDAVRKVSEISSVRYVEMGSKAHLCNDIAREISGINAIHTNRFSGFPKGYTGKDIVVGMIDIGIDYNHITFCDENGNLRIKRVWDMNAIGKAPEPYGYGAEYTNEDEIRAAETDYTGEYHGTHTTGTAAGGDRSSAYYGMAPDADIVIVAFNSNTANLPDAVKYITDYAKSVGKPCVINMSLGSHLGPHDGTSTLDKYFDSATGEGVLLVGSVGNEGEAKMHVGKTFTASSTELKTLIQIPTSGSKNTALDIWGNSGSEFTIQMVITDAKGKIVERSQEVNSSETESVLKSFNDEYTDAYCRIYPSKEPDTDAPNIYVECYITSLGDTRNFGIVIKGSDGNSINMWNLSQNNFVSGGFRGWVNGDNSMTAGEIGGTSKSIISVGSYNSRYTFPIWSEPGSSYGIEGYGPDELPLNKPSMFTSCGPTVDGRMKPEVLAPGAFLVSGMNGYSSDATTYASQMIGRTLDSKGKAHYYYLSLGTSMSAPVVTGSLALWLEADPSLTPERVRDILSKTSRNDQYLSGYDNNTIGYGRFDAYAGLNEVLQQVSTADITAETEVQRAWVETGSKTICVSSATETTVDIFSVYGSLVGSYRVNPGLDHIDASTLTSGVYVLRFANTGKSLKLALN